MIESNVHKRRHHRRNSIAPSNSLRGHFIALARQVRQWSMTDAETRVGPVAIGVTSLQRGDGTSTVSFNLTCSLASLCRTRAVLVESDFGNPYISRRLGHAKSVGLSELLLGVAGKEEAVFATPVADVSVIGCGQKSSHESLELPYEGLETLLKDLQSEYSYSVFDLPMASDLTACHPIASYLDGLILTVDANRIDQRRVERFKKQVENYGVPVIGIVLNKS